MVHSAFSSVKCLVADCAAWRGQNGVFCPEHLTIARSVLSDERIEEVCDFFNGSKADLKLAPIYTDILRVAAAGREAKAQAATT